jgi:hypothetical protein
MYIRAPSFVATVTEKVYCPLCEATNTPDHLTLNGDGFALVPQAAAFVSEDRTLSVIKTVVLLRSPVPIVVVP